MAIPTSRTRMAAEIMIDASLCTGCGLCVEVCKDYSLELDGEKVRVSTTPVFGCMACGHCMAICPRSAISIQGRELSPEHLFKLPVAEEAAGYTQLISLYQRRRSIREFDHREVSDNIVNQVLNAASQAPMGLPPTDVHVMVLHGRDKVRAFAEDFVSYLDKMKWFFSKTFIGLMRPFWGRDTDALFRGFLKPLYHKYSASMKDGRNLVNYDAPVALYFYATPFSDPADPIIAATYAMLAAEASGLGTCLLGAVHPFIQNGSAGRKFREAHGIRYKSKEGIFLIMGYPSVKYHQGIQRSFASVDIY